MVLNLLFGVWALIVAFWLLNHFFYGNKKYEEEYRRGLHPRR